MTYYIETDELIDDLQIVTDALGHVPTMSEYDEHGEYSAHTIAKRFDGWRNAMSAIEVDTSGMEGTRRRLMCRECGAEFRTTQHTFRSPSTVSCSRCGATNTLLKGTLRWQAENATTYSRLARGPMTSEEVPNRGRPNGVEKLTVPSSASSTDLPGGDSQAQTTVYYLPGDIRRAMDRFIEENNAYVTANVEGPNNHLKMNWSREMWQILLEQYYFNGHRNEELDGTADELEVAQDD